MGSINNRGQYVTDAGSVIDYLGDEPADGHIPEVVYAGDLDAPQTETSTIGPDGLRHERVDEDLVAEYWRAKGQQYPAGAEAAAEEPEPVEADQVVAEEPVATALPDATTTEEQSAVSPTAEES